MMKTVVRTPTGSYPVLLGRGLVRQVGRLLEEQGLAGPVAVVSNPTVWGLHGAAVESGLRDVCPEPIVCLAPDGEVHKTLATVGHLYDRFTEARLERTNPVLALGGGVIGDLAGFAAATYLRGVPLVHLPTTLLAMVDSSIGGKVAVDHPRGKNLVGAFYQPRLVVADPDVLATLPATEMACGMAEVIKAALIGDEALFARLEEEGRPELDWTIGRAVGVKVAVVEEDPHEQGRREALNLGHTFGHALEVLSDYRLGHGRAVSIGLAAATRLAVRLGRCGAGTEARVLALLHRFGLPTAFRGWEAEQVWTAMSTDKKRRGGRLRLVLPIAIGRVVVAGQVPEAEVLGALREVRERGGEG